MRHLHQTELIIKTTLRFGNRVIKDRLLISEVELASLKDEDSRKEIILGARRFSYARCLNAYRRLFKPYVKANAHRRKKSKS